MPSEIYDIHPHIISDDPARYPPGPLRGKQSVWSAERPLTFDQLVAEMDRAGVAKAAIVQAATYYGFDNSYVADSIARMPERFTGVCSIDMFADDAVDVLKGWLARGFSGLRIFTGGATHGADDSVLADPRSWPVWDYAQGEGLAIAVQTAPSGLANLSALLDRFPDARVVLDHIGRPVLEDGPPYAKARSLFDLAAYPNLFLKITPRSFALAETGDSTSAAFFGALVAAFGADRIAFGSNLPANEGPMTALVAQAREGLSTLAPEDQAMILSGTAARLYPALA
jgi:predicted TIM-barrel fold metal-dependent hydrolase